MEAASKAERRKKQKSDSKIRCMKNKTPIHVSIENSIYERLCMFQQDQVGKPSFSGIMNTALDSLMDDRGY
jgi:hypothetical protein